MVTDVEGSEVVARSRSDAEQPRAWDETDRLEDATLPGAEEEDEANDAMMKTGDATRSDVYRCNDDRQVKMLVEKIVCVTQSAECWSIPVKTRATPLNANNST